MWSQMSTSHGRRASWPPSGGQAVSGPGRGKGEDTGMLRRLTIGTLAAAALLGGSVLTVTVERAQAQALSCNSWQGNNWACSENHFNQGSPDRNTMQVPDRAPQTTASAAQSGQAVSQAGPQPEQQEEAHE